MINGGQVCVCPDYVFVPDGRIDMFVDIAHGMFPSIVSNDDHRSSVNEADFGRVVGLIDDTRAKGARVETRACG
jgi:coniferyl-aldehyde dehydrogenase